MPYFITISNPNGLSDRVNSPTQLHSADTLTQPHFSQVHHRLRLYCTSQYDLCRSTAMHASYSHVRCQQCRMGPPGITPTLVRCWPNVLKQPIAPKSDRSRDGSGDDGQKTEEWQAATKYNFNKKTLQRKKKKRKKERKKKKELTRWNEDFFSFCLFFRLCSVSFSRLLCRSFSLFFPASLLELHLMSSLCTLH